MISRKNHYRGDGGFSDFWEGMTSISEKAFVYK